MLNQERDSFVFVSDNSALQTRFKQACEFLLYDARHQTQIEELLEIDTIRPKTIVVDMGGDFAAREKSLQKLRQSLPKSQILVLVPDVTDEIRKKCEDLRIHFALPEAVFLQSFAPEFFLFQRGFCEFLEISPTDLFPDTVVFFNAYHFLPLNQKYLPYVHEDFTLSEKKYKRIESMKALYIQHKDAATYTQYIEKYFDQFNIGLRKRAKSKVYELISVWRDELVERIAALEKKSSFATEHSEFALIMNDLVQYLRAAPDPWNLIFEIAHVGNLQFERSLLETIISCFFTRYIGQDEMERVFEIKWAMTTSRILADPLLYKKWLMDGAVNFSNEEKEIWNTQLSKVIDPLEEVIKKDLEQYKKHFISLEDKNVTDATLVHVYWGEITASVLQASPADNYKKNDLMESVMVRCKGEGALSEAWIEELRNFIIKGPAAEGAKE